MAHLLFSLDRYDEVQQLVTTFIGFLPLVSLHFLHFQLVNVVRSELTLHHIVHQLGIPLNCSLLLFLQRLLSSLRVGRHPACNFVNYFARSRISFLIMLVKFL